MQADGKQVSKIHHEGWKALQEAILEKTDPVMQFGVASARLEEKVRKASFTLEDMLDSRRQMQKMGPMGQIMSMIPGIT